MIKVAIVDDQKVVTQGLKALLDIEPDVQIVGTGSNGEEAIHLAETLSPDVLLIDQYMPVMDGTTATKIISSRFPKIAVLLLSGSESDDTIAAALRAGAKGYLLKSTSAEDLANSIRSVHRGYSQMGPGLMEKVLAKMSSTSATEGNAVQETATPTFTNRLLPLLSDPTRFDIEANRLLLDSVNSSAVAADLMTQIDRKLQRNPNHVTALYLAGELIHKYNQHSRLSINYFRLAFQHSQQQNFSSTVSLHVCQSAWKANSGEVLGWLKELLRTWQPNQPRSEFFKVLGQVFMPSSSPYRLIRSAWEIQCASRLCASLNTLKPKIESLVAQNRAPYSRATQSSYSSRSQVGVTPLDRIEERSFERN